MRTKASGEATRERLLQAGVEALTELEVADLVTAVGTRELARRAGVSPATFFHHFENAQAYASALLARVYSVERAQAPTKSSAAVDLIRRSALPVDQAYTMHASELVRLTTDPEFRVRLGLWALGGPDASAAFKAFMAGVDDAITPSMQELVASWGREVRPPFTNAHLLAFHTALIQGAATRHLVDPERMPVEIFQRSGAAIEIVALRLKGDRRTVDDRMAEINYYPMRSVKAGDRSAHTKARILDAAAETYGLHGYEATTVAMVARAAGLSQATVYDHFGSKAGIATNLFLRQAQDVLGAAEEAGLPRDPADALHAFLLAVVTFTGLRADHTGPYLLGLACATPGQGLDDHVLARTADRLGAALPQTANLTEEEVEDRARTLLVALLGRTVSYPGQDPESVTTWVERALLPGLLQA